MKGCEKNAQCVRGFRHFGKGGKCSINVLRCKTLAVAKKAEVDAFVHTAKLLRDAASYIDRRSDAASALSVSGAFRHSVREDTLP